MTVAKDQNNVPVVDNRFSLSAEKLITFAGGTANAIGDHDGTQDPFTIFTVTGTVLLRIIGVCETDLVGAGTLEVGVTGNTAILLAQVADATTIDSGEIWHDATVDAKVEAVSVLGDGKVIAGGLDVIGTVGTANITAGAIRFLAFWYPLSEGASVVPA